jgi:hypothetical protein
MLCAEPRFLSPKHLMILTRICVVLDKIFGSRRNLGIYEIQAAILMTNLAQTLRARRFVAMKL